MGSLHNDLATWAGKARARGQEIIWLDLETAERIAARIVELATARDAAVAEAKALREAIKPFAALNIGNHTDPAFVAYGTAAVGVTVGNILNARATLAQPAADGGAT